MSVFGENWPTNWYLGKECSFLIEKKHMGFMHLVFVPKKKENLFFFVGLAKPHPTQEAVSGTITPRPRLWHHYAPLEKIVWLRTCQCPTYAELQGLPWKALKKNCPRHTKAPTKWLKCFGPRPRHSGAEGAGSSAVPKTVHGDILFRQGFRNADFILISPRTPPSRGNYIYSLPPYIN